MEETPLVFVHQFQHYVMGLLFETQHFWLEQALVAGSVCKINATKWKSFLKSFEMSKDGTIKTNTCHTTMQQK